MDSGTDGGELSALQEANADERAGEVQDAEHHGDLAVVANGEASGGEQSGDGPSRRRAVAPKPFTGLNPAPRDRSPDVASSGGTPVAGMDPALVTVQLLGAEA